MPNWCSNRLIVKDMTIEEFKSLYYGEENCFSFDKVIPIGEWDYDNAINAWGTKWDAANPESYNEDENGFILDFQSAWSPPDPVINKLNENHPDARFKLLYYEPGCDFCGVNSITGDYTYSFMDGVKDNWDEDLKSYIKQEREWFEEDEE